MPPNDSALVSHLRGLEGVRFGEVDAEVEEATFIGRVAGPQDGRLAVEEVVPDGTHGELAQRVVGQVLHLLWDQKEGVFYHAVGNHKDTHN